MGKTNEPGLSSHADTFAWDYENRMTSATVSGVTTTFAYRGDGLRNSVTAGGSTEFIPDFLLFADLLRP